MYIPKLITIGKAMLIVLLVYTGLKMLTSIVGIKRTSVIKSAKADVRNPQPDTESSIKEPVINYSQIIQKNPFGTSNQSMTSEDNRFNKSSISDIGANLNNWDTYDSDLILVGTISGSENTARAIIKSSKTRTTDLYKIGQLINNARIDEIRNNSVLLVKNGQKKLLNINEWMSNTESQYNNKSDFSPQSNVDKQIIEEFIAMDEYAGKSDYAQKLLSKSVVKPHVVNGQNVGLKVSDLGNPEIAERIGIKKDDIINAVNGHQLTDKRQAAQVLKKARNQKQISVDILREGKAKNITLKF